MYEDEPADIGRRRDFIDRAGKAMTRFLGPLDLIVTEVSLVHEQIDVAYGLHIRGARGGCCIGDIGERAIGPIESIAYSTTRMRERKVCHLHLADVYSIFV